MLEDTIRVKRLH